MSVHRTELHCPAMNSKALQFTKLTKGNRAIADLRYAKEDSTIPSTLIFAAAKG